MKPNYKTDRLLLGPLNVTDAAFIFELVNTAGWIKFIGDRNVKNVADAVQYIEKIKNNTAVEYRVVSLQTNNRPIGLVTLIKRDYLQHHDIGFAFLPAYQKYGYAFEASQAVLTDLLHQPRYKTILATTVPGNTTSVQLLEKLGLHFTSEIKHDGIVLHLYGITQSII